MSSRYRLLTDDLVQLADVHEASVIDLLQKIFRTNKFYTGLGDILVAVNPFKKPDISHPKEMTRLLEYEDGKLMLPHPYQGDWFAYRDLCEYNRSQSLSGGSLERVVQAERYRACVSWLSLELRDHQLESRDSSWQSNPILEAR